MNAMERIAHGKPIFGCKLRNIIGKMIPPVLPYQMVSGSFTICGTVRNTHEKKGAPMAEPEEANPIAMGLLVENWVEISAIAGTYIIPAPSPTQMPCARKT